MARTTRRPEKVYAFVLWILSLIFAASLIGLGGLVISDLPKVSRDIQVEDFIDTAARDALTDAIATNETRLDDNRDALEDARLVLKSARSDLAAGQEGLRAWRETRGVIDRPDTDPELIARTRAVEDLKAQERAALATIERLEANALVLGRENTRLRAENDALPAAALPAYHRAINHQELRVFGLRLAVTLPLLVLAGWLLKRRRSSAYWPLYRGVVLFAAFTFFVELVPYLPSYGGYVWYGVAVIAVGITGHFVIGAMRRYLAAQRAAETRSEPERRKSIAYETALRKIEAKVCPGCDRKIAPRAEGPAEFCEHCGIRHHEPCRECGTSKTAFHRYCGSCGSDHMPQAETVPDAPSPLP